MSISGGFFQKKARFGLGDRFRGGNGVRGRVEWRFSEAFFMEFEKSLLLFIDKILDASLDFAQTTDREICRFCAYNEVCNIHE